MLFCFQRRLINLGWCVEGYGHFDNIQDALDKAYNICETETSKDHIRVRASTKAADYAHLIPGKYFDQEI